MRKHKFSKRALNCAREHFENSRQYGLELCKLEPEILKVAKNTEKSHF